LDAFSFKIARSPTVVKRRLAEERLAIST